MKIKEIALFMWFCIAYLFMSIMVLCWALVNDKCLFPCTAAPLLVFFILICGVLYIIPKFVGMIKWILNKIVRVG